MKISARNKTLLLRMLALILVMLIGAVMFMFIEGRKQKEDKTKRLGDIKQALSVSHNVSEQDLDTLVQAVRNDDISSGQIPWNFGNSLYFSVVVITTIGYGHMAPQTWEGQLFCIFYSLLGIPITALLLKSVGEYINLAINNVLLVIENRVIKRRLASLETKCFIVSIALMIFMLIIAGIFTSFFDGWSFMEGVYFTFVTLSTIGFGDYAINNGQLTSENTTKTVITPFLLIFLILGLGVVSSVLFSISKILETGGFSCCKRGRQNESAQQNVEMFPQTVDNINET